MNTLSLTQFRGQELYVLIKKKNRNTFNENGLVVIDKLIGFDDAIVLDHKVFVRNVEDNNIEDSEDNVEEREE
mgnify:CR=1 FL=1